VNFTVYSLLVLTRLNDRLFIYLYPRKNVWNVVYNIGATLSIGSCVLLVCLYIFLPVCAANCFHISYKIGMTFDICKLYEVYLCKTHFLYIFMPPPFEECWKGIKCYPCPCVRSCVRPSVRPSVIKIWCPLNNFWKTALIQFKFGVLIYNIKTQVKFDLGYNPLIFNRVMGLL